MTSGPSSRRLQLQHLLFAILLVVGLVPMAIVSTLLISRSRAVLETQELANLTGAAEALSDSLDGHLRSLELQLYQTGVSVLAAPGDEPLAERLRAPWVQELLEVTAARNPDLLVLRVLSPAGQGARLGSVGLPGGVGEMLDRAYRQSLQEPDGLVLDFASPAGDERPVTVLARPVSVEGRERRVVVQAAARLPMLDRLIDRRREHGVEVFLVDPQQRVGWSASSDPRLESALEGSELLGGLTRSPMAMTREYDLEVGGGRRRTIAQLSPLVAGWGVVIQKPAAEAYPAVRRMIVNSILSTVLLVLLALLLAAVTARRLSLPIHRLAATSHQIAAGNLGRRVAEDAWVAELDSLAGDFNRMSAKVERSYEELRRSAQANRELFLGSIRAFAAAIDAKDPYTHGHSERVATYALSLARRLHLPAKVQDDAHVGAWLHDVGKLVLDVRILQKGGRLTPEEFAEMKRHPEIGARILSSIDQLGSVLPAVRHHHEAWNGSGYPDGLKGDEIPLVARIVAVADCFDALTTHRPYQRGFTQEYAVETITRLAGERFDAKVVSAFLKAVQAGEIQDRRAPEEPEPTSVLVDPEAAFSL